MCMAGHVGQRLGGNAKSSNLHCRRQCWERLRCGNEHLQAFRGLMLAGLVPDRRDETELVQRRRPQRIHKAPEIAERDLDLVAQPTQQ